MEETIRLEKIIPRQTHCDLVISTLEKPLAVDEHVIHKFRLVEGVVLTSSQLGQLQAEAGLRACDTELARLLSMREHSVGEVKLKLRRKGFDPDAIRAVCRKYDRLGLLDDARFARKLAESTLARNPCGRPYLIGVLEKKMVPRPLAEQAVDMVLKDIDEIDLAVRSLRKRWSLYSQFELETARTKAYYYLSRKGISYQAAKAAFEKMYNEN
jgi:regulatory protein